MTERVPCLCGCGLYPVKPTQRWRRGHSSTARKLPRERLCACGCGYLVTADELRVRYVRGHQLLRYPIDAGPLARCKADANGCLNFPARPGSENPHNIKLQSGRWITPSRLAWEEQHGSIPEGMDVCHTCDNRRCCNLDHLFLGTHQDNMRDMAAKDRWGNQTRPGARQLVGAA